MSGNWVLRKRPARLERRFEFASYDETRDFLDKAAELAEAEGYYPDMSFGRTHVSVTLQGEQDSEVGDELRSYAEKLDALVVSVRLVS